ncbi:polysaccharide deacetylase family protein [Verminephrobacter eiseniae]|uniref:polysaccharide deacetylase family protein n=1 Tax=Verminephrobacter eiseniae TaxID=364317 RepID=UPI0022377E11|nr:polysaccharide deacetylase family protein [Verminephrobacter eiseniae]MCW5259845.1 polysaccharide deacetylase family protein [Verminephrobacter eiseniae]
MGHRDGGWKTEGAGYRFAIIIIAYCVYGSCASAEKDCHQPLYLTFDTGHMGIAPLVAEVLKRQQVRVTFFAANERTKEGDGSLGEHWAPWWRARAAEGHEFASHTWSHGYWRADLGHAPNPSFLVRPSAGPRAGQEFAMSAADYCADITQAAERLRLLTGRAPLPLFRAPGGKTSPQLLASARACGYLHVGWSPAGFLGDDLPSERISNAALLRKALRGVRSGDILLAHLGIWSRKDPWAPAVLEPLIVGLKQQGFCFRTLREHPALREHLAAHAHSGDAAATAR